MYEIPKIILFLMKMDRYLKAIRPTHSTPPRGALISKDRMEEYPMDLSRILVLLEVLVAKPLIVSSDSLHDIKLFSVSQEFGLCWSVWHDQHDQQPIHNGGYTNNHKQHFIRLHGILSSSLKKTIGNARKDNSAETIESIENCGPAKMFGVSVVLVKYHNKDGRHKRLKNPKQGSKKNECGV
ncbi:hypothetical protein OGATHE_002268 [Ogataea polymorpha]|uniref:Uncharacterized protein n=1 Tax=Ogataea polymorpha TaxID=460523 RepID=A0A9P8PI19_9ASCO|nr:hypothetical protein OGATHE_002268 [Ogataea polymorpha]